MSSLKERSKTYKRISLELAENEKIVIELCINGVPVCEKLLCVDKYKHDFLTENNEIQYTITDIK